MWQELKIATTQEQAEELCEHLQQLGANAVTLQDAKDQPVFEPAVGTAPLWDTLFVTALFESNRDLEPVLNYLKKYQLLSNKHKLTQLPDKDWEREWMDQFEATQFGKRLWIVPSWQTAPDPNAVNIDLDPGLAFGTGTHATTALCLEWLDQHLQTGQSIIDYGCGSGILAIAAAKLGARKVWGTDTDPQALQATQANADKNQVTLELYTPQKFPVTQADCVIANILAQPLITLAPTLATLVKPQGQLVLSGILEHQAKEVMAAYQPWFRFNAPIFKENWALLSSDRLPRRRHPRA